MWWIVWLEEHYRYYTEVVNRYDMQNLNKEAFTMQQLIMLIYRAKIQKIYSANISSVFFWFCRRVKDDRSRARTAVS
jgi:hypothetical protein